MEYLVLILKRVRLCYNFILLANSGVHVTSKKNHFICHAYAHIIQQVYRKNWMFRLVGSEVFHIGKNKKVAEITISSKGMSFEYALTVDGKPLEKFVQVHAKNTRTWLPNINGIDHRIVLGKNISLDYAFTHQSLR